MAAGLKGQDVRGFLGVNLRRDRMSIADEELAKAINADLHVQTGSVVLRLGRTPQMTLALADTLIRRLAKINGSRYRVATRSVYRDMTRILNGTLSASLITTLLPFRPLNDSATWAFIADDAIMRKDDAATPRTYTWGIAVPSAAPTVKIGGLGTGLTGVYAAAYTYIRFDGTAVAHEGNPSAQASLTLADQTLALGDIPHPSDAQVNGIGIYRTVTAGSDLLLDSRESIPTTTTPISVTHAFEVTAVSSGLQLHHSFDLGSGQRGTQAWEPSTGTAAENASGYHGTHLWEIDLSYATGQTKRWAYPSDGADGTLGAAVEDDNDVPPVASWVTEFNSHAILVRDASNPHYLWWSKRFRPEAWPSDNFMEIGNANDPLQCAVPLAGLLGVFSRQTKYRMTGNVTSGFVAQEAISKRGTPAPMAVIASELGILFPARDGVFRTNLIAPDDELSGSIAPIFYGEAVNGIEAVNWSAAKTMAAAYFKGRYYLALPSGAEATPDLLAVYSKDTQRWYFFDHPARSLLVEEDTDQLTAGFTDGFVYLLETADEGDDGAAIGLDVETKDYGGGVPDLRKLFVYARVDADTQGEAISVDMYVDGELVRTATLTSARGRELLPFPNASMGYAWRLGFRYSGTKRVRIFGCAALYMPLEPA